MVRVINLLCVAVQMDNLSGENHVINVVKIAHDTVT